MDKAKKEMMEKLRNVESMEKYNLEMLGKSDDVEIDDIKYLGEAELTYTENGKKEVYKISVYAVIEGETIKYYSDDMPLAAETKNIGHKKNAIIPSPEYEKLFEKDNSIRDIIENLKQKDQEEKEQPEGKRTVKSLRKLEEEEKGEEQTEQEEQEINLDGKKPKDVMQTVNIDKAYAEEWKTVRRALGLPPQVKKITVAKPLKDDLNPLSPDLTIYMLDSKGDIIESIDDRNINDFFELDMAAGKNAVSNKNTQLNLDTDNAERTDGQVMRNFRSKENPNLYVSTSKKKVGEYVKVSLGRKSRDGNDFVGIQLETENVEIQPNLKKQKIVSGYRGIYNTDNIDKEVDEHEEHGDDMDDIPIENADGLENTEECEGRVPWDSGRIRR